MISYLCNAGMGPNRKLSRGAITLALLLHLAGCAVKNKIDKVDPAILSENAAKEALLSMLAAPIAVGSVPPGTGDVFDNLRSANNVGRLKGTIPKAGPAGLIQIGEWDCDLEGRGFTTSLANRSHLYIIKGQFVADASGSWRARITEVEVIRKPE